MALGRVVMKSCRALLRPVAARVAGAGLLLAVGLALAVAPGSRQALPDLLDQAVVPPGGQAAASGVPVRAVLSIDRQGQRVLSVGSRGVILLSEDGAVTWRQVKSPVSTDLVSVRFASPTVAWAVGHDAVALRSDDAGATWQRVLDGRSVLRLLREAYPAATHPELAREVEAAMSQSATSDVWPAPLLDIRFIDAQRGWAVGAFGLMLHTADGGKTWAPWLEHADNEFRNHLYALGGDARQFYIAGEQGLLLRLSDDGRRFARVETPYKGTFFGVTLVGKHLLAYGLRGNAFVSDDSGSSWHPVKTGVEGNLIAALDTPSGVLLVSQDGDAVLADLASRSARSLPRLPGPAILGAVATDDRRLAVARLNGPGSLEWAVHAVR